MITTLPITAVIFFTGFLAITGAPPFGIFLTKLFILSASITTYFAVGIIVALSMAVLFIGFFKHITAMIFGEKPASTAVGEESIWLTVPPLLLIAIAFCLTFYLPPFLHTLIINVSTHY